MNSIDTKEIIKQIDKIYVYSSEDFENIEKIEELTQLLRNISDGFLACEALIELIERHPEIEFGMPGEPIHTLETFVGYYEDFLIKSLKRKPTSMTIWMLNRIINSKSGIEKKELMDLMKECEKHPKADDLAKKQAKEFIEYQIKK